MKKIIILIIILIIGGLIIKYNNFENTKITIKNFEIKNGDNAYKIRNKLCKENIVNDCLSFKFYLFFNKYDKIKKWIYNFSGESLSWFFQQLSIWPKQKFIKFTILPWWTKFDIKDKLNKNIQNNFISLVNNKEFIKKIKNKYTILNSFWNINSLEWFLYPDTYFFKKEDINSYLFPELLIKTAIKNFEKKWKSIKCKKNCNPYKLSNYEILKIASIIEKEEKNNQNKPLIADILIRRYKNNWFIWADWTLCYGLKINSKNCKNYLFNKYLKDKNNPYNTRTNIWLPPTPVWNPTISSIKAVLYPKKNNYWYYLHWKDGKIHFGKNENEHYLNKKKYIK